MTFAALNLLFPLVLAAHNADEFRRYEDFVREYHGRLPVGLATRNVMRIAAILLPVAAAALAVPTYLWKPPALMTIARIAILALMLNAISHCVLSLKRRSMLPGTPLGDRSGLAVFPGVRLHDAIATRGLVVVPLPLRHTGRDGYADCRLRIPRDGFRRRPANRNENPSGRFVGSVGIGNQICRSTPPPPCASPVRALHVRASSARPAHTCGSSPRPAPRGSDNTSRNKAIVFHNEPFPGKPIWYGPVVNVIAKETTAKKKSVAPRM